MGKAVGKSYTVQSLSMCVVLHPDNLELCVVTPSPLHARTTKVSVGNKKKKKKEAPCIMCKE